MNSITSQVLTLFLIVVVGLIAAKVNIFTDDVRKKMSDMLLNIVSPLLILKSFQIDYSQEILGNMGVTALAAVCVIGLGIIVGKLIFKKAPEDKRSVLWYASAFPNCGYLGIPVVGGIFGDEGVIYVAVFMMVFQVYMWTAGILIFTGKTEKWYKPLTRPGMIAVIIGLLTFTFGIKYPVPLYNTFSMVGGMTSPLAMLLVGAFLSDSTIKEMVTDKHTYLIALLRFAVYPTLTYFALKPFGIPYVVFATIVLLSSMPAATNTVILATKFDGNPKFASRMVTMTTLMAMALIPVWMYIINL